MARLPEPKTTLQAGFKPKWTPAKALDHWPPRDIRGQYRVKAGESWLAIAMGWLVPDVWDLIYFNFRTEDPKKVNWYMRHYLGCCKPAADGKNFSFADADPGLLYIPPHSWKRGGTGTLFHLEVAAQLDKLVKHFPYLVYRNIHISRTHLQAVIAALRDGRIGAVHDPALAFPAVYRPDANVIAVKGLGLSSWLSRNFLAHEAVHAIMDMQKADILNWEDELCCYTAQALWGRAADDSQGEGIVNATPVPYSWREAYILARYLRGTGKTMKRMKDVDITLPDYRDATRTLNPVANLKVAIMNSPTYIAQPWWSKSYTDGI
jgi:hypothetical protein